RYGFAEDSAWRITDIEHTPAATRWRVLHDGKVWADFEFPLAGEYNVLNATAAAAMAANYGIGSDLIAEALQTFRSVKRRLEVKAEIHGITIIDDFAHHPTAITQTLKAVRARYAGRRLWAVLEPRSNTLRRKVFQRELAESLAIADQIVLADVFKSEAIPEHERLNPTAVVADLNASGERARLLGNVDEIVGAIASELRRGDVVAILSNGGFGGIYEKLPAKLQSIHEVKTTA
ncbi:MAG: cyanophycin synthetase, partial [Candidatus Korobacteraceae bacterium]